MQLTALVIFRFMMEQIEKQLGLSRKGRKRVNLRIMIVADLRELKKNCNATTVVGVAGDGLPGVGDTSPPDRPGRIRAPGFVILAHELCGHALPNMRHPKIDTNGDGKPDKWAWNAYTPDDPVIQIENIIREEHSSEEDCLGQRTSNPNIDRAPKPER